MKRRFVGIVLAMLLLNGCGNVNETNNQATADTAVETQQENVSAETESKFDYYAVINDINWNGTILKQPFTVDDLGEGYTLDYFKSYDDKKTNKKYVVYGLEYDSKDFGMIARENIRKGKDHGEIHQLAINESNGGDYSNISVGKIKIGMKITDVIDVWGEAPDVLELTKENQYDYYAADDKNKYISVITDKSGKVVGFNIIM